MRAFALLLILTTPVVYAQNSLVDWAQLNGTSASAQPPAGVDGDNRGALTFYATRPDFDAVFPVTSQVCEDFEDGNINDGDITGFPAPLDSATDNAVFPAGTIAPGLSIEDDPLNDAGGGAADGLVAIGATAFGTPSDIVVANTFVDSIVYNFAGGTGGVAMDVFSFTAGGTATVTFFDASDVMLGSTTVAAGTATGGFVGASGPMPIARVVINSVDGTGADEAEGGDNICFAAGMIETPQVPTLSPVGFVAMILVLLTAGALVMRRRNIGLGR